MTESSTSLAETPSSSWLAVAIASLAYGAVLMFSNLAAAGPAGSTLDRLAEETHGVVGSATIFSLVALWAASFGMFAVGKLRLRDVGLRASKLVPAALFLLVFWLGTQALWVAIARVRGESLRADALWEFDRSFALGSLTSQLVGNALVEELFFRAYLMPQLALKLGKGRLGLCAAILVSTSLFTLTHLPQLAYWAPDNVKEWLMAVFALGLFMCLLYLVTSNLFVCVAAHALWNAPVARFEGDLKRREAVWWSVAVLLSLACWALGAIRRKREAAPAAGV